MKKYKILVVDDEAKLRSVICKYLIHADFLVDEACNGAEALLKIENEVYDLVILDVMMPAIDGWTVCREIREHTDTYIIMLTARGQETDRLFGFEMGADDYVTKPFSLQELVARIRAVLNRSRLSKGAITKIFKFGDLKIDLLSRQVSVFETEVRLTPREYDLLAYMAQNVGIVMTRETLLVKVWGYDYTGDDRTVDTFVRQIRDKLGKSKGHIATVWGTGYKFIERIENE